MGHNVLDNAMCKTQQSFNNFNMLGRHLTSVQPHVSSITIQSKPQSPDYITHMIIFTRLSYFSRATLKSWEEPGYEASMALVVLFSWTVMNNIFTVHVHVLCILNRTMSSYRGRKRKHNQTVESHPPAKRWRGKNSSWPQGGQYTPSNTRTVSISEGTSSSFNHTIVRPPQLIFHD